MPSLQGNWYEARSTATTSLRSPTRIGRICSSGAEESSSGAVAMDSGACGQGYGHLCGELLEYVAGKLQVLPRLALVPGGAQRGGGMIRHDQWCVQLAEVVHPPAQPCERGIGREQVLRRDAPDREDQPRLQQRDLAQQVRQAGGDLLRLRVAVAGLPALEHVGNVDVAAAVEADGGQHFVEQLTGDAHERLAGAVLLGPRGFADYQPVGALRPDTEHALRTRRMQRAASTAHDLVPQPVPARRQLRGRELLRRGRAAAARHPQVDAD